MEHSTRTRIRHPQRTARIAVGIAAFGAIALMAAAPRSSSAAISAAPSVSTNLPRAAQGVALTQDARMLAQETSSTTEPVATSGPATSSGEPAPTTASGTTGGETSGAPTSVPSQADESSGTLTWVWILLAGGVIGFVVAMVVLRRRRAARPPRHERH